MKDAVIVVRGTLDWAKITGKARPYTGNPKYDKGPYWSVDITPDAKSRELIEKFGITKKLREPGEKDHRKETFLTLKVLENRADGEKNDPPKIVDVTGKAWDNKLIGNGSKADIKVKVKDYGAGSEKGVYLQAVRILSHVPYEIEEFAPIKEDDEFYNAEAGDETVDERELDDEIPF